MTKTLKILKSKALDFCCICIHNVIYCNLPFLSFVEVVGDRFEELNSLDGTVCAAEEFPSIDRVLFGENVLEVTSTFESSSMCSKGNKLGLFAKHSEKKKK